MWKNFHFHEVVEKRIAKKIAHTVVFTKQIYLPT